MTRVRCADGRVHFSELKKIALSPLHYKHACENATEATRAMSVGTIGHHIVLGPRADKGLVVYKGGRRQGKEWDAFKAEHKDAEIVTVAEWEEGEAIAAAILGDPIAKPYLDGLHEVPLEWTDGGIDFATRGVDTVGEDFISECKSTVSAEPSRFQRLALNMMYHVQMVMSLDAVNFHRDLQGRPRVPDSRLFIIGCESKPPHPVTVLHLTPQVVELARKTLALWTERLRTCEENDFWPSYSQGVVELDAPAWMYPEDEDE